MRRHRAQTNDSRMPQVGGFRLESPYLARIGAGLGEITPEITVHFSTFSHNSLKMGIVQKCG